MQLDLDKGTYHPASSPYNIYNINYLYGCIVDDANSQVIWSFAYWASSLNQRTAATPILPSTGNTTYLDEAISIFQGYLDPNSPSTLLVTALGRSYSPGIPVAVFQITVDNRTMKSVNLGGTDATYSTIGALNLNKQVGTHRMMV